MDKTKNNNDKNESIAPRIIPGGRDGAAVHKLPTKGESLFHQEFGLWICRTGRSNGSQSSIHVTNNRYFDFYCISQLLDGTGYYRTDTSEIHPMKPGQGVLVTPGQLHMYGGYNDRYVENSLCFSGRLPDVLRGIGVISSGVLDMDDSKRLTDIIKKAIDPGVISQTEANLDLLEYLYDLHRLNQQKTVTGDLLDDLTDIIQRDKSRWWTVQEMAAYCNTSDVRFRQIFKERHGLSPKRYIDSLRINSAIEQLSNPDRKISDIAQSLGYIDPFHFSRRFKQMTGHSPRSYRQNILVK